MRIHVDRDRCEGHGMCVVAAPEVFSLDDDGVVEYAFAGTDVPDALASGARFAVTTCPVAALRLTQPPAR